MIRVADENTFPLANTPEHVPLRRGGRKLHQSTAFRWASRGVRGIRLETIRVGGTLCTSVEALQRFFECLSQTDERSSDGASPRTSTARRRAVEAADRELDRLGV